MPYYTFHDREYRPLGMGSLEKRVINYVRPLFKRAFKTDTRGVALQSMAGEFMAKNGINQTQRALIVHFLKKHFRAIATDSDPSKPPVSPRAPKGQMQLTFESVLHKHLTTE